MRLLLVAVLLAGTALAQHDIVELECPPGVNYRVNRDLDGDGLDELVVVTNRAVWMWRGRSGAMPRAPDLKMTLPEGTAMFDIDGEGVIARTAAGYFRMTPEGPAKTKLESGPGLPRRPANVLWRGFREDFDGDGADDWIDLSLRGYRIHYADATVLLPPRLMEQADTSHHAASDRIVARYAIGDWHVGDFDGDGKRDFAVAVPDGLFVYPGDERGRVSPARTKELKFGLGDDAELKFLDFNGDNRTDVFAVRRKAGKAIVLIAGEDGLAKPRRIGLTIPGEIRKPVAEDLDGDGRPDLALPFTGKPSISMAMRALVQGEVILQVPVFLNKGGEDCITPRADRTIELPVRIRVGTDSAGRITLGGLVVVEYGGDLDGDGRKDLLVTAAADRLALHPGRPGEMVFATDPTETIAIPDSAAFGSVYPAAGNLNGDDRSDIILFYDGKGRRPDRLFVLLSRKK